MRHAELKDEMLRLVNAKREWAGVPPVVMGDNAAAQLHAEQALANCTGAHWSTDGTKPYMRYSLAGGYQSNSENSSGVMYCPREGERYTPLEPMKEIGERVNSWMNSPGHRRTMLAPAYKKLNVGVAYDKHVMFVFQHFEGDYVIFETLPAISDAGVLRFDVRLKNGAQFVNGSGEEDVFISIDYDPPLRSLTRGQLVRTYCVPSGVRVASLRPPLTDGSFYTKDSSAYKMSRCPDPYDIDPNVSNPRTANETIGRYEAAKAAADKGVVKTVQVPWVTARVWDTRLRGLKVEADISDVLRKHSYGIYTLTINAQVDGRNEWIAQYSIWYGIEPPDTYSSH